MEFFKNRLIQERDELESKYIRLGNFLHNGKHKQLSDIQSHLLTLQHNVMGTYLNILEMRIDAR